MWVLSWKKYALSKFATFVSILGTLTRYAGVMCLFSGLIPAGLICIAIGIAIHFGAEALAKNKADKVIAKANSENTVNVTETTATPKQNKCIKCGEILAPENKFCPKCGYEIK